MAFTSKASGEFLFIFENSIHSPHSMNLFPSLPLKTREKRGRRRREPVATVRSWRAPSSHTPKIAPTRPTPHGRGAGVEPPTGSREGAATRRNRRHGSPGARDPRRHIEAIAAVQKCHLYRRLGRRTSISPSPPPQGPHSAALLEATAPAAPPPCVRRPARRVRTQLEAPVEAPWLVEPHAPHSPRSRSPLPQSPLAPHPPRTPGEPWAPCPGIRAPDHYAPAPRPLRRTGGILDIFTTDHGNC